MSDHRTFTAGQAALITGIPAVKQQDWRRRGILPAGDGKWTRPSLRDLCWLRMLATLIDNGFPVGVATDHLADEFVDSLASMVLAAATPGRYDPMLAVIARDPSGKGFHYRVIFSLLDLREFQVDEDGGRSEFAFSSLVIINLASIAAEMAAAIETSEA